MTDYAFEIRQKFIRESATLEAKRAEVRSRMHAEGRYLLGEEALAKQCNGSIFKPSTGWNQK